MKKPKKTPPRRQRMYFIICMASVAALALTIILTTFRDNIVFFKTPTEVLSAPIYNKNLRIGGMVEKGSIKNPSDTNYEFEVTDLKTKLKVQYSGLLPDLFREGQGVVADGKLTPEGVFVAHEILAKHDENYMPPKIQKELDKNAPTNR